MLNYTRLSHLVISFDEMINGHFRYLLKVISVDEITNGHQVDQDEAPHSLFTQLSPLV